MIISSVEVLNVSPDHHDLQGPYTHQCVVNMFSNVCFRIQIRLYRIQHLPDSLTLLKVAEDDITFKLAIFFF